MKPNPKREAHIAAEDAAEPRQPQFPHRENSLATESTSGCPELSNTSNPAQFDPNRPEIFCGFSDLDLGFNWVSFVEGLVFEGERRIGLEAKFWRIGGFWRSRAI